MLIASFAALMITTSILFVGIEQSGQGDGRILTGNQCFTYWRRLGPTKPNLNTVPSADHMLLHSCRQTLYLQS
ncbi:hypothetical protein O206_19285 [Ochrobactrum sp. EGD-AQ16]|nr:hypothetical protein O206_19285 [Ochrobactrum sp. EGD-AQ16]